MSEGHVLLERGSGDLFAGDATESDDRAIPLTDTAAEPGVLSKAVDPYEAEEIEPGHALVPADFATPRAGVLGASLRIAYRLGIPGSFLAAPLRKPSRPRILATVASPLAGDRTRGMALRAGHFLVHGVKAPIAKTDYGASANLSPPFCRTVHGFTWLRDLASCHPREECVEVAEAILKQWLSANPGPGKGPAWTAEHAGQRLMNWLIQAPLIFSGGTPGLRPRALAQIETTARWLDKRVGKSDDKLGAMIGWCAIVAAGLLLPDGKPRRLFGEAGLVRALGEVASEDGGVLSRSPLAQMDAIAAIVDLRACYEAAGREPPVALRAILDLLVPPLLALRHGDGGLGSWQGAGATSSYDLAALIDASGVRARPAKDLANWGYQRADAGLAVLQVDAAPPPKPRHARFGCASTLAFEFSHGEQRIIVNCGGAALSGGLVPARIEQGLRATAAHSTLVLDDANSTAILMKGQVGKGVEAVDVIRSEARQAGRPVTRIEASHDGYGARHGLRHRRVLTLGADGHDLIGEDMLEPVGRSKKRGKIAFAIRFHIAPGIAIGLSEDCRGAGLALADGSYWQMRLGGDTGAHELAIEDSLWVDGGGRPRPAKQLVLSGMTSRSGERFPWLLKRMG